MHTYYPFSYWALKAEEKSLEPEMYVSYVKSYLELVLKRLGCKNINISDDALPSKIICGFSHPCSMIITDLSNKIPQFIVYRAGQQQYIVTFSRDIIVDLLRNAFHNLVNKANVYGGRYDKNGFTFYSYSDFERILTYTFSPTLQKLQAAGIDHGVKEEVTIDHKLELVSLNFRFLAIYNIDQFFAATSPVNARENQERVERQTFLQKAKTVGVSGAAAAVMNNRQMVNHIFGFLRTASPRKSNIPMKMYALEQDEKSTNKLTKLEDVIKALQQELKKDPEQLKKDKLHFLQLVYAYKQANPRFALKDCLAIVKSTNPNLYSRAREGIWSRTKTLCDEINQTDSSSSTRISL